MEKNNNIKLIYKNSKSIVNILHLVQSGILHHNRCLEHPTNFFKIKFPNYLKNMQNTNIKESTVIDR